MEYIQKVQKNHQRKEEQLNAIYGTEVLAAYLISEVSSDGDLIAIDYQI